jgi:hypothetical protein
VVEVCNNGVDDDCDGLVDAADQDCGCTTDWWNWWQPRCTCPATERDADGNCAIDESWWGSACADGNDNDGNGQADCADADCAGEPGCAGSVEACGNGADDDGDGLIDCADADCAGEPGCQNSGNREACGNGADDDGDGLVDCADLDCEKEPRCLCDEDGVCEGDEFLDPKCADCFDEQVEWIADYCSDPRNNGEPVRYGLIIPNETVAPSTTYCAYGISSSEPDYIDENMRIETDTVSVWRLCHDGADNDDDGEADCRDGDCYAAGANVQDALATDDDGNPIEGFDAAKDWERYGYIYEEETRRVGCYCGDGECTTNYEDSFLCPEDCSS